MKEETGLENDEGDLKTRPRHDLHTVETETELGNGT